MYKICTVRKPGKIEFEMTSIISYEKIVFQSQRSNAKIYGRMSQIFSLLELITQCFIIQKNCIYNFLNNMKNMQY